MISLSHFRVFRFPRTQFSWVDFFGKINTKSSKNTSTTSNCTSLQAKWAFHDVRLLDTKKRASENSGRQCHIYLEDEGGTDPFSSPYFFSQFCSSWFSASLPTILRHRIYTSWICFHSVWKITEKVSLNIASEAWYVYILSGQKKFIKNVKRGQFW